MFPDLAVRVKRYAANMGSGFVVIAGFMLAVTMAFVIVFARWNGIRNDTSNYSIDTDKPRTESFAKEYAHRSIILPDNSGD